MLYTRESGNKNDPAIVFLHGGGLSSRMWLPQFERLPGFYCLAPDLPEQWQSQAVRPFDLDDTAQRVSEIIRERVPARRAHVVGLSLGGAAVLTLLRVAPGVVDHAMVSGTAARLGRGMGAFALASLWMLRFYKPESLVNATIKQQGIPDEYRDLVYEDLRTTATEAFNRTTIRAIMSMQLPLDYHGPLLVAAGSKETGPAKAAARKLVASVPGARGVMVPGRGHVWNLQDPDLFAATVRAWVTDAALPEILEPILP